MPRYYYLLNDVVHGPIEVQDLKRRFVSGEVDQLAAYVRREDRKDWVPASQLRFKSDPRTKKKASPFSIDSDVELEELVELEEIDDEPAAEIPLNRVRSEIEKPQPREKKSYSLWSPSWSSFLSFFFTTAFGSYVHARNWEILEHPQKAALNMIFFWISVGLLSGELLLGLLSGFNVSFARLAYFFASSNGLLIFIWYFVVGRSQSTYFNRRFPRGYRRISWRGSWIGIACAVWIIHGAVQVYWIPNLIGLSFNFQALKPLLAERGFGELLLARVGVKSTFRGEASPKDPPAVPPSGVFQLVKYDTPIGKMSAYVTPNPGDGKKHPAIIWIAGGDCNALHHVWEPASPENDQTAAAYRKAGIVMMFPSLRGGNDNPGKRECFLGEVEDIVSAAKHLAAIKYVDPHRIYLGGHSTGGTMAMLVSECTNRFRAVFAFGPAEDIRGYAHFIKGIESLDPHEVKIRSPYYWLSEIKSPTFVIEGTNNGNVDSLFRMSQASKNPQIHFLPVAGCNHFDVLAPCNQFIAEQINKDTGYTCNISMTDSELVERCSRHRMDQQKIQWENDDARHQQAMANHAANGMPPNGFPPFGLPQPGNPTPEMMPPGLKVPPPLPPPPALRQPPPSPAPQSKPNSPVRRSTPPLPSAPGQKEDAPKPSALASSPKPAEASTPPGLFKPATLSRDDQIKQMCDELNGLDKSNRTRMKELIEDLSKTKDEKAIRPIVRRVADAYPTAERALAPFGSDAEKVVLDELKDANDVEYIQRLADALGTVGTKESISTLRKLTKHESKFVRLSAESSITKINRQR
ncbi:prolyl oligopeptidase family serine peptidase [bacterium]|nr:prolyl oligopeptidase family serine peptidase [bacterium]